MALNPSIILAGQQPDIVNALDRGNVAGQRNIEFGRQNALNALYQAQGPAIAQGEQSALNALSRFDPMASLGVQDARLGQDQTRLGMDATRLGMDATRQNMSQNDQKMQMALEQHAASLSAAEREQQRMDIENDLAVLMTAQTPQQWDQMAEQTGNPNMVGQFDNREAAIAPFIGLKEVLERQGGGDPTSAMQNFDFMVSQGVDPEQAMERAFSGTSITNNVGAGETAFGKKTGEILATEAAEVVAQGSQAQRSMGQINTLEQALGNAPSGAAGALLNAAANIGIKTEGSSDIEVANAIISQLVPAQRPPGSGVMSDADLEMFRQSLPRLINTRDGNRRIIETMRGIAEYDMKRGQIARRLQLGEITPQEASQQYQALGNPLSSFQSPQSAGAAQPTGGQSARSSIPPLPQGIDVTPEEWPQIWEKMSDEDKALFQ